MSHSPLSVLMNKCPLCGLSLSVGGWYTPSINLYLVFHTWHKSSDAETEEEKIQQHWNLGSKEKINLECWRRIPVSYNLNLIFVVLAVNPISAIVSYTQPVNWSDGGGDGVTSLKKSQMGQAGEVKPKQMLKWLVCLLSMSIKDRLCDSPLN